MAIISIIGNVDKRIIAIPLARALSIDGKTAIITNESSYRRLYKDSSEVGSVSGVNIVLDYSLNMKSVEKLESTGELYKHYLFISDGFIAKNSACTIVCRGRDRSFMADDVAKAISKEDEQGNIVTTANEIILTSGKVEKKESTNVLVMVAKHYMYLADMEEVKELSSPNDVVLAKTISKLVGNSAGINAPTLEKLINRQTVITAKEVSGKRRVK